MVYKSIVVKSHSGLHNRQATLFVQKANEFDCTIFLERGNQRINAKSLLGIMCFEVRTGEAITIRADGNDEDNAISCLETFLVNDVY